MVTCPPPETSQPRSLMISVRIPFMLRGWKKQAGIVSGSAPRSIISSPSLQSLKAHNLTGVDLQAETVERDGPAELLRHVLECDRRRTHGLPPRPR